MDDYNTSDPKGTSGRKWFHIPLKRGTKTAEMPDPKLLEKGRYDEWGEVYGGVGRYVMHGTTIENLWDILCWGKVCRSLPQNGTEALDSPERFRANGCYGGTSKMAASYRPWCFLGDKWMIAAFAVFDTEGDKLTRLVGSELGTRKGQILLEGRRGVPIAGLVIGTANQAITDSGEAFLIRPLPGDMEKSGFARQFTRLSTTGQLPQSTQSLGDQRDLRRRGSRLTMRRS